MATTLEDEQVWVKAEPTASEESGKLMEGFCDQFWTPEGTIMVQALPPIDDDDDSDIEIQIEVEEIVERQPEEYRKTDGALSQTPLRQVEKIEVEVDVPPISSIDLPPMSDHSTINLDDMMSSANADPVIERALLGIMNDQDWPLLSDQPRTLQEPRQQMPLLQQNLDGQFEVPLEKLGIDPRYPLAPPKKAKKYFCEICGKGYVSKYRYREHFDRHEDETNVDGVPVVKVMPVWKKGGGNVLVETRVLGAIQSNVKSLVQQENVDEQGKGERKEFPGQVLMINPPLSDTGRFIIQESSASMQAKEKEKEKEREREREKEKKKKEAGPNVSELSEFLIPKDAAERNGTLPVASKETEGAEGEDLEIVSEDKTASDPAKSERFSCGICGLVYRRLGNFQAHINSHKALKRVAAATTKPENVLGQNIVAQLTMNNEKLVKKFIKPGRKIVMQPLSSVEHAETDMEVDVVGGEDSADVVRELQNQKGKVKSIQICTNPPQLNNVKKNNFVCGLCGSSFINRYVLNTHLKTHEEGDEPTSQTQVSSSEAKPVAKETGAPPTNRVRRRKAVLQVREDTFWEEEPEITPQDFCQVKVEAEDHDDIKFPVDRKNNDEYDDDGEEFDGAEDEDGDEDDDEEEIDVSDSENEENENKEPDWSGAEGDDGDDDDKEESAKPSTSRVTRQGKNVLEREDKDVEVSVKRCRTN